MTYEEILCDAKNLYAAYKASIKGSKSKDVRLLQERLNELGYSVGTADGSYGMKSVTAVTEFQANNGIEATGIADVATQEVLFSDAAIGK